MKISQLQNLLKQVKKEFGNVEVYLSCDSEGNGYATTDLNSNYWDKDKIVLYPFEENIELSFTDTTKEA
jgi:hypothetical protein